MRRVLLLGMYVTVLMAGGGLAACGSSSAAVCPDQPDKGGPGGPCPVCPEEASVAKAKKPVAVSADELRLDRPRRIALAALTEDGGRALLRVEDSNVGTYFQTVQLAVTDTAVPKVDKTFMFDRPTETSVRAQALKGFKAHPGPPSQVNAAGVTLLAADRGAAVVVYALSGERAVPVIELPRLADADGRRSDVTMVKLAWDPTGQRAIIIHRQTTTADLGFSSDWIHVVPVPAGALPF